MKKIKFLGSEKKKFKVDGKALVSGQELEYTDSLKHLAKMKEFIVIDDEKNEIIINAEVKEDAPVVSEREDIVDENENGIDDEIDEAIEELEENIDEIEDKIEEIKEESKMPKKRGRKKKIINNDDDK